MIKIIRKFIEFTFFASLGVVSFKVMAEYRAYQYLIKSKINPSNDELKTYTTIKNSTLSPTSFIAYNGGPSTIKIELIHTWMCPGYTSKKPICKPLAQGNNGN